MERILFIVNRRSGMMGGYLSDIVDAINDAWESPSRRIYLQITRSAEDGKAKARDAVREGFRAVIVAGGDGTINSIGAELIGSETALGAIPCGSGNGFVRYLGYGGSPRSVTLALARAATTRIDAGVVNGRPFFVTCSLAWEAAIAGAYERFPFRGVAPYVLAGAVTLFACKSEPVDVRLDEDSPFTIDDPLLLTIANMTQFGGNALIAPQARADDGRLNLVMARRRAIPRLLLNFQRFFDGTVGMLPEVVSASFTRLRATRASATDIQVDGERLAAAAEIEISVMPGALRVLTPPESMSNF